MKDVDVISRHFNGCIVLKETNRNKTIFKLQNEIWNKPLNVLITINANASPNMIASEVIRIAELLINKTTAPTIKC